MREALPPRPIHGNWKDLYRAAILENDSSVVDQRISAAKKAIVARGRELLYESGTREERNAVYHALRALHAYKAARERADAA